MISSPLFRRRIYTESVNQALADAVAEMKWPDQREVKSARILFLVGDAPPHMDYLEDLTWPTALTNQSKRS